MTKAKEKAVESPKQQSSTLICHMAFRLEIDGLSLEIARGTKIVCTGSVTRIFDFEISNPKLITKLGEAKKQGWLTDGD